ncbi:SusD family [Sphingobacterium spiritivorum]|uniref:SusD family n=1 Tax=Sphingobacterium spiritivorum TaxID=258 RepID=A0A380BN55_SPHSI|nr:RagB/SusD family nutrient uptake outer membrane protein [Sphingobacterium spiritivorum]SUJ03535.1 SusD family [Sphingobacterium spiritivorum]
MKTTIKNIPSTAFLLLLMLIVFLLSGCSKFLDKDPTFIVKENYYKTEADVQAGLTGVYDILGKEEVYGSNLSVYLPISDEGVYYRSAYVAGLSVYNFDASESNVRALWRYLYEGIERANTLLYRINEVQMDETVKKVTIGEARFLRAYYYFLLVSHWGSVPLKTLPTASVTDVNIEGTPPKDIYAFVVSEMEAAEAMVKNINEYGYSGRVTRTAVQGILARVYLKMAGFPLNDVSKYEKALEWSGKVVHSSGYQHALIGDYAKLFKDMASDKYNIQESIWEVEFAGNRSADFEAGRLGNAIGIQCNDEAYGYSYGFIATTKRLYQAYENTDLRRDWNIATYKYSYVNNKVTDSVYYVATDIENRHAAKYRRPYERVLPRNKNYTPINFPLLRYSDVLLMYAEAENEVNGATAEAKAAVKQVRDRAKASDKSTAIGTKDDMRQLIRDERFRELAFEGIRKYDLIRWGLFQSNMKSLASEIETSAPAAVKYMALAGKNVAERDLLLPIPIAEISLNNAIKQNPGW